MSEKLLSAKEIATRLEVEPITVRVWLKKGLFANAKLTEVPPFGKTWQIPESDLDGFIKPEMGRPKKPKD